MQNKQADHKNELKSNLPHPVTSIYPKTNLANSIVTFIPTNITYAKINCGQFKCKTKMRMFSYKNNCLLVTFHNMSYKPWEVQHCMYNDSRALKKKSPISNSLPSTKAANCSWKQSNLLVVHLEAATKRHSFSPFLDYTLKAKKCSYLVLLLQEQGKSSLA